MLHDSLQLDLETKEKVGVYKYGEGTPNTEISCWEMVSFTQGHLLTKKSFIYIQK